MGKADMGRVDDGWVKVRPGYRNFCQLPKDLRGLQLHSLEMGLYATSDNYQPMRLFLGGYELIKRPKAKLKAALKAARSNEKVT